MKRIALGIRAQFLIAGTLLVVATAVSSTWSAASFREVSRVVGESVRDTEQTTAAADALSTAIEREDDALLLTLTDDARGRRALGTDRDAVANALLRLDAILTTPAERETSASVQGEVDAYHRAGDALIAHARDPEARLRYHETVNPLLRRAVSTIGRIRDDHFRSAQRTASWARDRAARSTEILSTVTLVALALSVLVALYLARTIVLPLRDMTTVVEAMRAGDFERRVPENRTDELGRLADGFNRMAADLAAFKRANIGEVIRAKETLETTLAALPDAVLVIEPAGTVATVNPRAAVLLGADACGRRLSDLRIDARTRDAVDAALRGTSNGLTDVADLAVAVSIEVGAVKRSLLPRVVPLSELPGGRSAILVLSDVTELVRLDEMRTELIAVASHELQTPLTTLRMTLLMLEERSSTLAERDQTLVRTALVGVEQLAGTVNEFLDLTRIEAGQLRLDWERLDVAALLDREAAAVRSACDDANIRVTVQAPRPSTAFVRGDAARLHVVLSNLLANAMKYSPSGGAITLSVDAARECVSIAVDDDGPGVPAEFRERIFEKFFRVEHHRDGDAGVRGTGIGLYVARQIIQAHGGTLRYEQRADGGARLVIRLARAPALSTTKQIAPSVAEQTRKTP